MNPRLVTSAHTLLLLSLVVLIPVAPATEPWRFVSPLPQGNNLHAAWAPGPNDLYVGGDGGIILHWDGAHWTAMQTPTQKTIFGIHGLSSSDIWAVGGDDYSSDVTERSVALHYDGSTWNEVPPPTFVGSTYPFNSVHMVGSNDVWAGHDGGPSLAHWDGSSWQFDLLDGLLVEGRFGAIDSIGPEHVFVVGDHGQILHRDNGTWKLEQKTESGSLSFNILTTVWAYDLNTVYAGGNYGQLYKRNPDGSWMEIHYPPDLVESYGMALLTGFSPTDLYWTGVNNLRRFDGTNPPMVYDFRTTIRRQWFEGTFAGDRIYMVGPAGVVHEIMPNSQGGEPIVSALSAGRSSLTFLRDFRATGCGPGFLVFGNSEGTSAPPLHYFEGTEILPFPEPPPEVATGAYVRAAIASDFEDITLNWYGAAQFNTGIQHWDGTAWSPLGSSFLSTTPTLVVAFWKSPGGTLYACGPNQISRYDDPEWSAFLPYGQLPTDTVFSAFWGRSESDLFVAGQDGRIWHYNGSEWSLETTPAITGTRGLTGLGGTPTDTYAVGSDGAAWHRMGTTWEQMPGVEVRAGDDFLDLVVDQDGVYAAQTTPGIYIGGGLGRLWRFEGQNAEVFQVGISEVVSALARAENGVLFGIGNSSGSTVILTDGPEPPGLGGGRVDLSSDNFQPVGTAGVFIRPGTLSAAKPWAATWRVDQGPALFDLDLPLLSQQWEVLHDEAQTTQALPPSWARFPYDPALLPEGFITGQGTLFRNTSTGWEAHGALVDPVAQIAFLMEPSNLSPWALAQSLETPTPGPSFTPTETNTPTATHTQTSTHTPAATSTPTPTVTPEATRTPTSSPSPTPPPPPDLALLLSGGLGTDPPGAPLTAPFHFSVWVTYKGPALPQIVPIDLRILPVEEANLAYTVLHTEVDLSTGSFADWILFPVAFDPTGIIGTYHLEAVADPANALAESDEVNNLGVETWTLKGPPSSGDGIPPTGTITINSGEQVVSNNWVDLHFQATDNSGVVTYRFVRELWLNDAGEWVVSWESGWMPYSTILSNHPILWSGLYLFEVSYSDAEGNVSLPASARVNVVRPLDSLGIGGLGGNAWFLLGASAGQPIGVTLEVTEGDGDLGIWTPGNLTDSPDFTSTNIGEVSEEISFEAALDGAFWLLLHAYEQTLFELSISLPEPAKQASAWVAQGTRTAGFPSVFPPASETFASARILSGISSDDAISLWLARTALSWGLGPPDEGYDKRCDFWPRDPVIDKRDLLRLLDLSVPPDRTGQLRP